MKNVTWLTCLLFITVKGFSQEQMVTLSGGSSFAKIEDTNIKASGWRINGLYEFIPDGSKWAHGVSVGYISISGSESDNLVTTTSTVKSVPIYYAPKYMFGSDKIKGFVKGALGMQFASLKREAVVNLSDHDLGFYGGAGAGVMLFIKKNIFINAEYEIAWASNHWYKDGWMNTAMGGIGLKF